MLWLNQQEASLFHLCSPLSSGSRAFSSLDGHTGLFLPLPSLSCMMSHPVITVSVNRLVFKTSRTDFRVKSPRTQVNHRYLVWNDGSIRLTSLLGSYLFFLQLVTLTFTNPEMSFLWGEDVTLQFQVKTTRWKLRAEYLLLWLSFWTEPVDTFPWINAPSGPRPLDLFWFCDMYSTLDYFLWLLL